MAVIKENGQVLYGEGENVPTIDQLLATATPVSRGAGREVQPKATDLSPVRPIRRKKDDEERG